MVKMNQKPSVDQTLKSVPQVLTSDNFRMICAFDFRREVAFVKFIGTHAEYDRIDALTVSKF